MKVAPMFSLSKVVKSFQDKIAIPELTLELQPGTTTALIGPSGCGKSTLLRLLVGLLIPDSGEVRFNGIPLTPHNVIPLRRQMGFVLQDGGLFPHLTLRQNVGLLSRHLGWDEARINMRVNDLAELTRLDVSLLDRYPNHVSGGQRQRVAMMRALMLDPPAILLDEPMGALDPLVRYELQEDLRKIFRELKKTVVLVTHDLGEAAYFADDLVLLKLGVVVQRGTVIDFRDRPADSFVTRFLQAQRAPFDSI